MDTPRGPLLIVGASTRAAAESAARAGFDVHAVDSFGDWDLRQVARVVVPDRWDEDASILNAASKLPPAPWLYTGAIENRPELIDALSRDRPLLGCPAEAVRSARDPIRFAEVVRQADCIAPEVSLTPPSPNQLERNRWLVKPIHSGGGLGVRFWTGQEPVPTGAYFQAFIKKSRPLWRDNSIMWLAGSRGCTPIGGLRMTRGTYGHPFGYTGNIGDGRLGLPNADAIRLGDYLRAAFGLIGLFGVDFVQDDEGRAHAVELNPRPTASLELLEILSGRSLIEAHVDACRGEPDAVPWKLNHQSVERWVYRLPMPVRIPTDWDWSAHVAAEDSATRFADLPMPGTRIERGEPILTLVTTAPDAHRIGTNEDAALARLRQWMDTWESP